MVAALPRTSSPSNLQCEIPFQSPPQHFKAFKTVKKILLWFEGSNWKLNHSYKIWSPIFGSLRDKPEIRVRDRIRLLTQIKVVYLFIFSRTVVSVNALAEKNSRLKGIFWCWNFFQLPYFSNKLFLLPPPLPLLFVILRHKINHDEKY